MIAFEAEANNFLPKWGRGQEADNRIDQRLKDTNQAAKFQSVQYFQSIMQHGVGAFASKLIKVKTKEV